MSARAARSIEEYLKQLRTALGPADGALIQEALEAAEDFLRSELAASRDRPEGEVLEFIASTYGAPEDLAAVYRVADRPSATVQARSAPPELSER